MGKAKGWKGRDGQQAELVGLLGGRWGGWLAGWRDAQGGVVACWRGAALERHCCDVGVINVKKQVSEQVKIALHR